jgi:hypothetical protein
VITGAEVTTGVETTTGVVVTTGVAVTGTGVVGGIVMVEMRFVRPWQKICALVHVTLESLDVSLMGSF